MHRTDFFKSLKGATRAYLLLDYDGTLAPFEVDPAKVKPYPGVVERLQAIAKNTPTSLYLISGRGCKNLLEMIPSVEFQEVWASHGAEQYTKEKKYWCLPLLPEQRISLHEARSLRLPEGAIIEAKPLSVAVHYRAITDEKKKKSIEEAVVASWKPHLENDLVVHYFSGGVELRPSKMSKAFAISHLLSEIPAEAPLAYLGDDASDEEAFSVIKERGLKVLVNGNSKSETHADIKLNPPKELLDFLDEWQKKMAS